MPEKLPKKNTNPLTIVIALGISLVVVDILFMSFTSGEAKTVKLLKQELTELERQEKIITSSQELYQTYQNEVEVISAVFPNEETIATFIQILEKEIRSVASEYTFKFNSQIPLKEQDKQFLPMTVTVRVDLVRLIVFLERLEQLPYMTHVSAMITKTPDGISSVGEVTIVLKVYVQNPFSAT